jgi:Na+-translocating ferredoxin:NAD+ oxidoreductase RNF subunit RnfB
MQERDRVAARLPGIDCGACGSPTCAAFAEDVVVSEAEPSQCVVLRQAQLEEQIARLTAPGAPMTGVDGGARRSGDDRH